MEREFSLRAARREAQVAKADEESFKDDTQCCMREIDTGGTPVAQEQQRDGVLGGRTVRSDQVSGGPDSAWEWVEKSRTITYVEWDTDHPQAVAVRAWTLRRWEESGERLEFTGLKFFYEWWESTDGGRVQRAVKEWIFQAEGRKITRSVRRIARMIMSIHGTIGRLVQWHVRHDYSYWINSAYYGMRWRLGIWAMRVEEFKYRQATDQEEIQEEQALRGESSDSDSGGDDSGDSCREDSEDRYVWVAHRRSRFRVA